MSKWTFKSCDALEWVKSQKEISNVITGIPDVSGFWGEISFSGYIKYLEEFVEEVLARMKKGCYLIFIHTDRKVGGILLSKTGVLAGAASAANANVIWHKIALHRGVGKIHLQRPTYAHMLCFSKDSTSGVATPDVIDGSKKLYRDGTSIEAARMAVKFVRNNSTVKEVVDPFCGRGTIPYMANKYGLDSIGIDIDPEQVKLADELVTSEYKRLLEECEAQSANEWKTDLPAPVTKVSGTIQEAEEYQAK